MEEEEEAGNVIIINVICSGAAGGLASWTVSGGQSVCLVAIRVVAGANPLREWPLLRLRPVNPAV